jgi:hypothetical protein
MKVPKRIVFRRSFFGFLLFVMSCQVPLTKAQGPAPESAPPLFPGGALLSYSSTFLTRGRMSGLAGGVPTTARPTFSHEGDFNFTWGFRPNFDVTAIVPIVTNDFDVGIPGGVVARGTGLGDTLLAVKYRFYRRDSKRGTTQASVRVGPKFPTGRTNLTALGGVCQQACSLARVQPTSSWRRTGPIRASFVSGGWLPTRTSMRWCDRKELKQRA